MKNKNSYSNTLSIIIPTKNERLNILILIKKLAELNIHEIIIVDDSTDGTANVLSDFDVKVIKGKNKGLSSAVYTGIQNATGRYICVMDADGSHPVDLIKKMVEEIDDDNIVIASRETTEYTIFRRFITFISTLFTRPLTSVKDPLSGFFMTNKDRVNFEIKSRGYKILLEILVKSGISEIVEVPYHFLDRSHGKSKTSIKTAGKFIFDTTLLYLYKFRQLLKFCIVGSIGVIINISLFLLLLQLETNYLLAGAVAFMASVFFNYTYDRKWCFQSQRKGAGTYLKFLSFSTVGLLINLVILSFLVGSVNISKFFSQLIAIGFVTLFNYKCSKKLFILKDV
jgi:dolichol-phosphate mannosyltransferase